MNIFHSSRCCIACKLSFYKRMLFPSFFAKVLCIIGDWWRRTFCGKVVELILQLCWKIFLSLSLFLIFLELLPSNISKCIWILIYLNTEVQYLLIGCLNMNLVYVFINFFTYSYGHFLETLLGKKFNFCFYSTTDGINLHHLDLSFVLMDKIVTCFVMGK